MITGQGGIQPAPADIVRYETAGIVDLGTVSNRQPNEPFSTELSETEQSVSSTEQPTEQPAEQPETMPIENIEAPLAETSQTELSFEEAQTWQRNAQGDIHLIAKASHRPENNRNQSPSCVHSRSAQS